MNTEIVDRKDKCVYVHKLDGVVVYVGSGTKERVNSKSPRTFEHIEIWDRLERTVYRDNLTLNESLELESSLIKQYWETGNLLNGKKFACKVKNISWQELSQSVYYSENSPTKLRWKVKPIRSSIEVDSVAGSIVGRYGEIRINSTVYKLHRVIYSICHGIDLSTDLVIDHLNRDKKDNRIENLKAVTQSLNCKNKKHKTSNTGHQCVVERLRSRNFIVSFRFDSKPQWRLFSYVDNKIASSTNHYPTRELALEAAVAYRDELVKQGLIVLT